MRPPTTSAGSIMPQRSMSQRSGLWRSHRRALPRRWPSGWQVVRIPAGNRLKSYRAARSAFSAVVLDPTGPCRESGKTGPEWRESPSNSVTSRRACRDSSLSGPKTSIKPFSSSIAVSRARPEQNRPCGADLVDHWDLRVNSLGRERSENSDSSPPRSGLPRRLLTCTRHHGTVSRHAATAVDVAGFCTPRRQSFWAHALIPPHD